ncbi:RNA polymerase I, putative [Plasmodium gallinaceum]|uniref:DNA-directed RNA polymerase subunit n=1 Tax=Plasmodium gallinaceum TaxID=5849 RepID=A0A1J1GZ77_PLAGA|nr:RNA polymerase I, putative [Plasmodium gallinaceum]CRG97870.1 RNA polymerase I, putative [Plasmodium gallinaceum]
MYDINNARCVEIKSAELDVLNSDELKRISLGKYENEHYEFEKVQKSGVTTKLYYDPRYGTIDNKQICSVCFERHENCFGHVGHLEFVLPLFNPLFYKELQELLNLVCYNCYNFCCSEDVIFLLKQVFQLKTLNEIESTNKLIYKENCDYEYLISEIEKLYKKICKDSDISLEDIIESISDEDESNTDNNLHNNDNDNLTTKGKEKNYLEELSEIDNKENNKLKEKINKYKFDANKLAYQSNYNYEEYLILSKTIKMHMKKSSKCYYCKFHRNISAKISQKRDTINFVGIYTKNSFFKKYFPKMKKKDDDSFDINEYDELNYESENEEKKKKRKLDESDHFVDINEKYTNNFKDYTFNEKMKKEMNSDSSIEHSLNNNDNNIYGNIDNNLNERNTSFSEMLDNYKKQNIKEKCTIRLFSFQVIDILKKIFVKNNKEIIDLLYPFTKKDGYKIFFLYDMGISANRFRSRYRGMHKRTKMAGTLCKINNFLNLCLNAKKEIDFDSLLEHNKKELTLYKQMFSLLSLKIRYKLNNNIMDDDTEITKMEFLKCYSLVYHNKSTYINILFSSLQIGVNTFYDSNLADKINNRNMTNIGIREILDKKEGILRKNIMGKRVNHCARTVISPDTFIETNQVGMPLEFAKVLTVDEYVTHHNLEYIKKLIENGPHIYPGAISYKDSKGRVFKISHDYEQRLKLLKQLDNINFRNENCYIVHRHARDGDIVIMNRQPTLHKFSIMAHYIKIFEKEKIFRLNYVNCSSYNADFDGDEMNMHLLQTPLARAEASHLMNCDFLFTSFKDGSPLRGLAQDFILGGLHLTSLETFLNYDEYCNLLQCSLNCLISQKNSFFFKKKKNMHKIDDTTTTTNNNNNNNNQNTPYNNKQNFNSFSGNNVKITNYNYLDPYANILNQINFSIVTDEPAILFPKKIWTGKQLITSILKTIIDKVAVETFNKNNDNEFMKNYKGINYTSKAKTSAELWSFDPVKECEVIIKNSELLQGILDKFHFGASSNSLIHLCFELFGPKTAGVLLDCFGRLFISFLQLRGSSLSLYDFILNKDAKREKSLIKKRISFTGFYLQNLFVHSIAKSLNADINDMNSYAKRKKECNNEKNDIIINKMYDSYKKKEEIISYFEQKKGKQLKLSSNSNKYMKEEKEANYSKKKSDILGSISNYKNMDNMKKEKEMELKKNYGVTDDNILKEKYIDLKEEKYFIALLNKKIEDICAQKIKEEKGTFFINNENTSNLDDKKRREMDSSDSDNIFKRNFTLYEKYINNKDDIYNCKQDEKKDSIILNTVIHKLYNSIKEPSFFSNPTFTGKKIIKIIEKILDFLKEAKCNKRLKIFIIFELFQNKNIMKYFPSLMNYLHDFNYDLSNEEIIKNVVNNIYFEEYCPTSPFKNPISLNKDNIIKNKDEYKLNKFINFYESSIHKKEDDAYTKKEITNSVDNISNNDDYELNIKEISLHDKKLIKNCLISSFPSFLLNDDICNLSYNDKYQYFEEYLKVKEEKEDGYFKFYDMKDIFYKMEYLINNFFSLNRFDFDTLIDSLFQPYLCRVSSSTDHLINMNNLINKFLNNGFSNMIFTGAKGSKVNYSMICGILDQQYLEGKRVPRMKSGKTLPSFHRYDYGARSCGLITDCFLEGLRPQEYFFHCMSGREGLIDTAVKTAKSGYIQRCLIKCMESVVLHYDGTVRNEDNSIIQFLYGEDGIDPSKTAYLDSSNDLLYNYNLSFSKYLKNNVHEKILNNEDIFQNHIRKWKDEEPVICHYNPYTFIGSVSDKFNKKLSKTFFNNFNFPNYRDLPKDFDTLSTLLLKSKYFNSLCNPGESIGILVAQSFGEPATQMTLNTFHLAGTENVTMGIPRLKEIFLTSKLTSKPMIYVPIKIELKTNDINKMKLYITNIADKILNSYKSICLSDVVYGVGVERKLILKENKNNVHYINGSEFDDEKVSSNIDVNVQVAKIMNVLKNVNISFDCKKEWNYEIIIQFENLYHFCKIYKQISIPFILHKVTSAILTSVLNKIQESLIFHNINSISSFNHEYYDELYDFISKKLVTEFNFNVEKYEYKDDEGQINAKLKYMANENKTDKSGDKQNDDQDDVNENYSNLQNKNAYNNNVGDSSYNGKKNKEFNVHSDIEDNDMSEKEENIYKGKKKWEGETESEAEKEEEESESEEGKGDENEYDEDDVIDSEVESEKDEDYNEENKNKVENEKYGNDDDDDDDDDEDEDEEKVEEENKQMKEKDNILNNNNVCRYEKDMSKLKNSKNTKSDKNKNEKNDENVNLHENSYFTNRNSSDELKLSESSNDSGTVNYFSSEASVTHHVSVESDDSNNIKDKICGENSHHKKNILDKNKMKTKEKIKASTITGSTTVSSPATSTISTPIKKIDEDTEEEKKDEDEEEEEEERKQKEKDEEENFTKSFENMLYNYKNNINLGDSESDEDEENGEKKNEQKFVKNIIDKIKSSLLRFVKKINFSPITWTLKFEVGWDINFFPYPIDFLTYLKSEISKETLYKVKDLNNPKILKGKDITHSGSEYELQIEGKNIYKLYNIKDKYIDKTKLYCNDIYAIVKTYGIEAGRLCITKELKKVFDAYGIKIDFRHLSFISDFMTHTGDLKAFNRHGMGNFRNVLHKMSFECATNFLIQGCVHKSIDHLSTASSSLFFGKHIKVGTNLADVITCIGK